jgi:hypothetical protein
MRNPIQSWSSVFLAYTKVFFLVSEIIKAVRKVYTGAG